MSTITVALLQLAAGADPAANLRAGMAACRRARRLGADIALLPEMWTTGYTAAVGATHQSLRERAISRHDPVLTRIGALAAELEMAIAFTYLERCDGRPRNTVTLFDRRGRAALTYAKVHTCAFDWPEVALAPGDRFPVAELDTAAGAVRVGAMICYDREFPESARALMLGGAELILCPNACPLEINRLSQLRARAYENMTALAVANYAGPGMGHSVAYDGLAFLPDGTSRDMTVVHAGETEGVYPAVFDLAALRDYRARESWGDAFRRPSCYQALTNPGVAQPFLRVDAAGAPPAR